MWESESSFYGARLITFETQPVDATTDDGI